MARKKNKHSSSDKRPSFDSKEASVKNNSYPNAKASVLPPKANNEAVCSSDGDVRPAKRQKVNAIVQTNPSVSSTPVSRNLQDDHKIPEDATPTSADSYRLPAELAHLQKEFTFTTMSILSSSKIEQKVRNLLLRTRIPDVTGDETKPGVVVLNAKGLSISKMVSVVEIAKRAIKAEGTKWFQVSCIETPPAIAMLSWSQLICLISNR